MTTEPPEIPLHVLPLILKPDIEAYRVQREKAEIVGAALLDTLALHGPDDPRTRRQVERYLEQRRERDRLRGVLDTEARKYRTRTRRE